MTQYDSSESVTPPHLAPVAETGLTAYKIVGHFFGLSYRKISGSNQVKNMFFRISNISVPCPHTQLRGRTVIKKLWTFFGPWGRVRSKSPPCCIFRIKQIHPTTASERTTRQRHTYVSCCHRPSLSWCIHHHNSALTLGALKYFRYSNGFFSN